MKKYLVTALCLAMIMSTMVISGCGKKEELPEIQLSVWVDENAAELMQSELEEFSELHKDEANFVFNISNEGADTCKEMVLTNPEAAADIFIFADDQFEELYQNGALLEITKDKDTIIENVGGYEAGAAGAVLRENKLYGYPLTAGNGYFLYYNKAYFSEEDVKQMDKILEIAEKNGKEFTMDYSSGWYIYSFFKGAGLEMSSMEDGKTNICNWNATDTEYTGVEVAEAMINIAKSESFASYADEGFVNAVNDGRVIAGINGAWNASKVESVWGENYAATMLPTFTLAGDQVQMCSFTGYKIMGINAHTEYPEYCMELAEYLTNEENQLEQFKMTGECPANVQAASSSEVLESPAVAALGMQSKYGYVQSVAENYWAAASKLGITLSSGNRDGRDLQELLDSTQAAITAPSGQKESDE